MELTVKFEADIEALKEWIQSNGNLPLEIDPILLRRFHKCMYGNIEGTKKLIEVNYGLRNKYKRIFLHRDPLDIDSQETFNYADLIPLPGLTPEKYKVSVYRLTDYDPQKMHHIEDTKAFFMITDCRFCVPDGPDGPDGLSEPDVLEAYLSDGEVQIFDMTGYSMRHVSRLSMSTLRIYIKFLQEAFPVRLKAIHLINCPTYMDKIVKVVKPFISQEVFELIHFHTDGIESLYEHVPRDMLPEEYGGKAGKILELKAAISYSLLEKRHYLMDPKQWQRKVPKPKLSFWRFNREISFS